MNHIETLEKLLKEDVLLEINENLKELQEAINQTPKDKTLKEELKYMQEVKAYFDEVLADIEHKTITQEQALDILEGLEDMRIDNQEV